MWKWLTVAACVITTGAALADEDKSDGNSLIHQCRFITEIKLQAPDEEAIQIGYDTGWCRGLIIGLVEEMKSVGKICLPAGVTYMQTWRVVKKFLDDNPTLLHRHRIYLIRTALVAAWPCKEASAARAGFCPTFPRG